MKFEMCAPCLMGIEGPLSHELKFMGAKKIHAKNAIVYFEGDENMLARANICSRFGERILIVLAKFRAITFEDLFQGVNAINWADYIGGHDAFPVRGYSRASALYSVRDCQKIIKKAVVEKLRSSYKTLWFDERGPVHQIQFSIMKDEVTIMLDTTGIGLHKRGYRPVGNDAPMRETLAAALCEIMHLRPYHTLYDPMCGSGTILIEGAMIANNIAPSLNRNFSAQRWGFIPKKVWEEERELAISHEVLYSEFRAFGSDIDPKAVKLTKRNANRAGVGSYIKVSTANVRKFSPSAERAIVVTNPPYGKRMLNATSAQSLYKALGERFTPKPGTAYGIISPDEYFEDCFGRKADKKRKLYNGMIKCDYYMYFDKPENENDKKNSAAKKRK